MKAHLPYSHHFGGFTPPSPRDFPKNLTKMTGHKRQKQLLGRKQDLKSL